MPMMSSRSIPVFLTQKNHYLNSNQAYFALVTGTSGFFIISGCYCYYYYWFSLKNNRPFLPAWLSLRRNAISHCSSSCSTNSKVKRSDDYAKYNYCELSVLDKVGAAISVVHSSYQNLLRRYFRRTDDINQDREIMGSGVVTTQESSDEHLFMDATSKTTTMQQEHLFDVASNSLNTTTAAAASVATANSKHSRRAIVEQLGRNDEEFVDTASKAVQTQQESEEQFRDRSNSLISAASVVTANNNQSISSKRPVVELLVHNVSHSDIVLSLGRRRITLDKIEPTKTQDDVTTSNWPTYEEKSEEQEIFCRPRFSAFDLFSRRVFAAAVSHSNELPIVSFPRYERSDSSPRYTLVTPTPSRQKLVPVGFALTQYDDNTRIDACRDMASLRLRGKDLSKIQREGLELQQQRVQSQTSDVSEEAIKEDMFINGVFLPLLAPLILTWVQQIKDKYHHHLQQQKNSNVKMVIVLVTGVGTPRNWTHTVTGNSTEFCAKIMELFLAILYPNISVVKIHSQTNLFRYDENISFAKRELMPCIEAYRDAHATGGKFPDEEQSQQQSLDERKNTTMYNPDWRESFHVTLSFADGSLARAHAIQAALRPYRPTYFHFWQLKTFWHESKITEEDIEILTFEDMETVPAMEISKTSEKVQMVVAEILSFKNDFLKKNSLSSRSDVRSFWLRKTQKPVLAVLLIESPEGKPLLYRGTNMEVSMPTGSLCAERCVIGSALANNPGLKREDLRMVAVLAVPLPKVDTAEGSTRRMTSFVEGNNNICSLIPLSIEASCHGVSRDNMLRSSSIASFASIKDEQEFSDKNLTETTFARNIGADFEQQVCYNESTSTRQVPPMAVVPVSVLGHDELAGEKQVKHINMYTNADVASDAGSDYGQYSRSKRPVMGGSRMQKTKVVVHHEADLNPLRPCGSCNEWLKKIAEPNPNFKVLTFTDADCTGVYVTPCQF